MLRDHITEGNIYQEFEDIPRKRDVRHLLAAITSIICFLYVCRRCNKLVTLSGTCSVFGHVSCRSVAYCPSSDNIPSHYYNISSLSLCARWKAEMCVLAVLGVLSQDLSATDARKPENIPRNRFRDISPYDVSITAKIPC